MKETEEIVEDFNICNKVFVYGTLKRGWYNNHLLEGSEFLGSVKSQKVGVLCDYGCPMFFPETECPTTTPIVHTLEGEWKGEMVLAPVRGELWEMEDYLTLVKLDFLESEGSFYYRKLMETADGDLCWGYFGQRPFFYQPAEVNNNLEWVWK